MPSRHCRPDRNTWRPCRCLSAPSPAPIGWRHRRRPTKLAAASNSYGIHGQRNDEYLSPRGAVEFDQAAVAADEVLRYAQTQSRAIGAPGHQRIKNRVANFREHSRTVVFELNRGKEPVTLRADAHVAYSASSKDESGRLHVAARQGLDGVAPEIQHGLNDVIRIHRERREARVVVAIDGDAFGRLTAQQMIDALQYFVHVDQLLRGRAGRPPQGMEPTGGEGRR